MPRLFHSQHVPATHCATTPAAAPAPARVHPEPRQLGTCPAMLHSCLVPRHTTTQPRHSLARCVGDKQDAASSFSRGTQLTNIPLLHQCTKYYQARLKVQLKLSISRLRMTQQKDSAKAKQQRREMAQLLEVRGLEKTIHSTTYTYKTSRQAKHNQQRYASRTSSAATSPPNSTRSSNYTANYCSRVHSCSNHRRHLMPRPRPQAPRSRSIPLSKKQCGALYTLPLEWKSRNYTAYGHC